jgi:hypothetical protein
VTSLPLDGQHGDVVALARARGAGTEGVNDRPQHLVEHAAQAQVGEAGGGDGLQPADVVALADELAVYEVVVEISTFSTRRSCEHGR